MTQTPATLLPRGKGDLLIGLAVVLAYALAAKLGFLIAFVEGNVSPLWPPSGIAVASLLIFGRRFWVACWIANALVSVLSGLPWMVAVAFASGNAFEYVLVSVLLSRYAPALHSFGSLRDVGVLLIATCGATLLAGLLGAATLVISGLAPLGAYSFMALTWWAGDAAGILILLPPILAWRNAGEHGKPWSLLCSRRFLGLAAIGALSSLFVFADPFGLEEHAMVLSYALFLLLLWAALRLGIWGATLGVVVLVVPAVVCTVGGHGPFVRPNLDDSIMLLMGFMVVSVIMALALSAVLTERDVATAKARMLSHAVEQSASAVVITNTDGDITYVNPAFTDLTGYEAANVLGRNPRFLKSGHMSAEEYQQLWQTVLSGQSWRGEFLNIRKDQGLVWEQTTISPVRNETGQMTHFVATAENITKRKADERRVHEALERTARAKEELERITFAITHTLQEPLRSIAGFAQLLNRRYRDVLDDTAEGYLQRIVDGADRMYHLFHDLMHYVMVDEDQEVVPVALQGVLEKVLGGLGDDQRLIRIDGELPTILGVERQLLRVFEHILGNSLKYRSADRPLDVVISAAPVETDEGKVRRANGLPAAETELWEIQIRDNGIGIDSAFQPKLFTLFSRLHTIEDYDGTGVGLAYCRRVIEHHGGSVWLESALGKGTTFHLIMPTS